MGIPTVKYCFMYNHVQKCLAIQPQQALTWRWFDQSLSSLSAKNYLMIPEKAELCFDVLDGEILPLLLTHKPMTYSIKSAIFKWHYRRR
jgi:hypothetical protein